MASVFPSPAAKTSETLGGASSSQAATVWPKANPSLPAGSKERLLRITVQRTSAEGMAPPNR